MMSQYRVGIETTFLVTADSPEEARQLIADVAISADLDDDLGDEAIDLGTTITVKTEGAS